VTINDNALRWRKSSHSGGGNDCVEVAFAGRTPVVRGSQRPHRGGLAVDPRPMAAGLVARGEDAVV
jgi:hypothetical protein